MRCVPYLMLRLAGNGMERVCFYRTTLVIVIVCRWWFLLLDVEMGGAAVDCASWWAVNIHNARK